MRGSEGESREGAMDDLTAALQSFASIIGVSMSIADSGHGSLRSYALGLSRQLTEISIGMYGVICQCLEIAESVSTGGYTEDQHPRLISELRNYLGAQDSIVATLMQIRNDIIGLQGFVLLPVITQESLIDEVIGIIHANLDSLTADYSRYQEVTIQFTGEYIVTNIPVVTGSHSLVDLAYATVDSNPEASPTEPTLSNETSSLSELVALPRSTGAMDLFGMMMSNKTDIPAWEEPQEMDLVAPASSLLLERDISL